MRILLYIVLLITPWIVPVESANVGELLPVEVVCVSVSKDFVSVRTDTGDYGAGTAIGEAFEDLQKTAPGVIYLDTAAYLLLEPGAEGVLMELKDYLKPDTKVCAAEANIKIDGIATYLAVHHPGIRLKTAEKVGQLPLLTEKDGRYWIQ